jgi:hypothetical protein
MVHSSALVISIDGECLMCGGFSLNEIVRFESLEFIVDYFGGLSLSPSGNDSGTTFMGSTRSESSLLWAMIEDSTEEFYMASSEEGGSSLPSSRRHGTGAPPGPIATTPWLEDAPATQVMTVGGHKMHIFTTNISIFHSRYRR